MKNEMFWEWFNSTAAPQLAKREVSFRKMFEYLDQVEGPLTIIETGCMREIGNRAGDGQSTLLWDKYVEFSGNANPLVLTVDLDPAATSACKAKVSQRVQVQTGDSVAVLGEVARQLKRSGRMINLLYMDSYDVDWADPTLSAVHHLKELVSVSTALSPRTLVVVDDAPQMAYVAPDQTGQYSIVISPKISGKALFVAEYARQVGAQLAFSHYQAGWLGMVKE